MYEDRVERCSGGGEARSEDRARIEWEETRTRNSFYCCSSGNTSSSGRAENSGDTAPSALRQNLYQMTQHIQLKSPSLSENLWKPCIHIWYWNEEMKQWMIKNVWWLMSKRALFTWIRPMDADIDICAEQFYLVPSRHPSNTAVSVMDKQQVRWIFNSAVCRKLNISWLWLTGRCI